MAMRATLNSSGFVVTCAKPIVQNNVQNPFKPLAWPTNIVSLRLGNYLPPVPTMKSSGFWTS